RAPYDLLAVSTNVIGRLGQGLLVDHTPLKTTRTDPMSHHTESKDPSSRRNVLIGGATAVGTLLAAGMSQPAAAKAIAPAATPQRGAAASSSTIVTKDGTQLY